MNNKEKTIYLSEFEPKVNDGPVEFVILGAEYDTITTKRGKNSEIVKLKLELQELNNPSSDKEVKNINLFVDRNPGGPFHRFIAASLKALSTTAFRPSLLINLRGKAVLSRHRPEGSDFSFPRVNDWIFYKSNEEVANALASYQEDNDIDFNLEEDGGEIV